jgi:hypothetical protein
LREKALGFTLGKAAGSILATVLAIGSRRDKG